MSPSGAAGKRGLKVFHVRLGGCGGCSDVVDAFLRDRTGGRISVMECSSPRHAALIVVSGVWDEGLARSAAQVLTQAPDGCRILIAGDCGLGEGPLAEALGGAGSVADHVDADGHVSGCPLSLDSLAEGVDDVTG